MHTHPGISANSPGFLKTQRLGRGGVLHCLRHYGLAMLVFDKLYEAVRLYIDFVDDFVVAENRDALDPAFANLSHLSPNAWRREDNQRMSRRHEWFGG